MLSVFSNKTSARNKFNTIREQPVTMCVTVYAKLAAKLLFVSLKMVSINQYFEQDAVGWLNFSLNL